MARKKISYGNSCLIALICASDRDLGSIGRCFYDDLCTPWNGCPYATAYIAPRLRMLMTTETIRSALSSCEINAVNGGQPVPYKPDYGALCHELNRPNHCASLGLEGKSAMQNIHYYDFAIIGECDDVDACLDIFLKRTGLLEVQNSNTYMSDDELRSFIRRRQQNALTF